MTPCPDCGWRSVVYTHVDGWLAVLCGWCGLELHGIACAEPEVAHEAA